MEEELQISFQIPPHLETFGRTTFECTTFLKKKVSLKYVLLFSQVGICNWLCGV